MNTVQPLLHIEDMYKQYGNAVILDDVDLKVQRGELCSLVGPSGCGKSTFMRIILGAEKQTSGIVTINGEPIDHPDSNKGIVYQKYGLFPHLTALENVLLFSKFTNGLFVSREKKQQAKHEALMFLEKVRLSEHANKLPHELSGGQQQRCALAQALIAKPSIMMMDEPFGALDPATREDLQLFLLELWEEFNMTVFFVTHDLEEACFVGSRLLCLSQYYSTSKNVKHGARFVYDIPLVKTTSVGYKKSPGVATIVEEVRQKGFNPTYLQHARDFDLRHKDSFRTTHSHEA